jgi:hypothetical protein
MSFFLIATLLLGVENEPPVDVQNVAGVARLDANSQRVKVVLRDHETLVAVLKKVPNVRQLEIIHPGHKMPLESIKLIASFKKLEELYLRGDPFLSDEKFVELGKLHRLKTLKLALP